MPRAFVVVAFALLPWANACAGLDDDAEPIANGAQPAIYGKDDRVEVFDLDAADPARVVAEEAVAALVPSARVLVDGGTVTVTGPTWGAERDLCEDVRFAEQPVIASCSAVLVDDDLLLTAGHCARLCSVTRVVFGLRYDAPSVLGAIPPEDVFDCVDVVADHTTADGVDFAWLRLDRSVDPARRPAALRLDPPRVGASSTLIGFPAGLPMKADAGGVVTRVEEGVFFTSNDAFEGNSGGPLLDADGAVIGVLGGGAADLMMTEAGCFVPAIAPEDHGVERSTSAARALDGLCAEDAGDPLCCSRRDVAACDPPDEDPTRAPGCALAGSPAHEGTSAWIVILGLVAAATKARRPSSSRRKAARRDGSSRPPGQLRPRRC